jgi:hypothetical protein
MRRTPLAVCLLAALAACDEAAAPKGRDGSLAVSAYVDTDASGTRSDADVPVSGLGITLLRDGEQVATATTDGEGEATFPALAPGSYRLSTSGPTPDGAALTTNPSPTAVINFRGDPLALEFRWVYFPGSLSGRIFREDNATDGYQGGADTPGAGLAVALRRDDGGAPGDTLATTTTGAEGAYEFPRLAPGTYFVELGNPGTIDYGENAEPQLVTVAPEQGATFDALFTGSLVITIAEARTKAANTPVAVEGFLSVPGGRFATGSFASSEIWVQDATGGIAVFSVPTADSLLYPLGQAVRIAGRISAFSGQVQIGSPVVTILAGSSAPVPKAVIGAQANSLEDEGSLVTLGGYTVTSVSTPNASGAFDVRGFDAAGDSVRVRVHGVLTGLTPAHFVAGERYAVTGVLTRFTSSGGTVTPQIKPRAPADVVAQGGPPPAGGIVISEFIANPGAVLDNAGEWIELHNTGTADVDIQGWSLRDNFGVDTIDVPLVIPAGGYVVLANNADAATNGGVTAAFQYVSAIALGNSGDRIVLKDASDATVDSVAYTSGAQAAAAVAMGLVDPSQDNADASGSNWVAQTSTYGAGDKGTPNAPNDGAVGGLSTSRGASHPAIRASSSRLTTTSGAAAPARRRDGGTR